MVKDVAEEERPVHARLQELAEQGAGRVTPDSLYAAVGVALRPCADHVVGKGATPAEKAEIMRRLIVRHPHGTVHALFR